MSDVVNPGKDARRLQRRQAETLRRERQKQNLEKAESEDVLSKKKGLAMSPTKGRRSLIQGMRDTLG